MRVVPEWIGKTDNAMPPTSVFRRLWAKQDGRCPVCTRKLEGGNIARDHIKALILGGTNTERNLRLVCERPCHQEKTAREQRVKAKTDRIINKTFGFQSPSKAKGRPVPGSKASKWARRYNRETGFFETVRRDNA